MKNSPKFISIPIELLRLLLDFFLRLFTISFQKHLCEMTVDTAVSGCSIYTFHYFSNPTPPYGNEMVSNVSNVKIISNYQILGKKSS
jgi:hypothetical protein